MDVFAVLAKKHLDSVVVDEHPAGARHRRAASHRQGTSGIRSRIGRSRRVR
jgi:hypothetical protein